MSFLTAREVNLLVNGKNILCNNISLSQTADLSRPYLVNESTSTRNIANFPKRNSLSFNYYLTGLCPLKDYCLTNHKFPLSGRINDNLQFNFGYLESYQLSARPNEPINVSAQIVICDEISGSLSSISPSQTNPNLQIWNYNDSIFSDESLNITNFTWSFKNEVQPIYFQKETGLSVINPDRIFIGQKEITAEIVSDSESLILGFTGTPFNIDFTCRDSSHNVNETYTISGFINRKDFSVSTNDLSQSLYSITQQHLNNEPKIDSIDTSTYPAQNYILIYSPNLVNGYFTPVNNFSLVEKVVLGDRELKFEVSRGASFDTITGYIPQDAINGTLQVYTTKGLIIYPSQVNLSFSGITISGFYPETGNYHDTILISGSNFNRITQVLFNNVSANFNVFNTTGFYNQLIANVPDNATVGKINIVSSLRNVSGVSTGTFYPIPEITGFFPVTGEWGSQISLNGKNFSGITNVYFNNIVSPSFTINTNSRITATVPGTGRGFTKGYIKLSGHRGMEGFSKTIYHPVLRISGISTISGGIDNDLKISGCFDSGYLNFSGGGFKIAFGNTSTYFYKSGDFLLSGLIPTGFFDGEFISLYEPDGVTKYPSFTGRFQQIGPKPIVETINGASFYSIRTYANETLSLGGQYFKDFFGLPYYVMISGTGSSYTYSNINYNSLGTQLNVPNVKITGATGFFDVYVVNYAGTGKMVGMVNSNVVPVLKSGLIATVGSDFARSLGTAAQFPNLNSPHYLTIIDNNNSFAGPGLASYANDGNNNSFSCTTFFPTPASLTSYQPNTTSGYITITFSQPINLSYVTLKQNSKIPDDAFNHIYPKNGQLIRNPALYIVSDNEFLLAESGLFFAFDNGNNIVYRTGVSFSNATHVLTGTLPNIRMIKFSRNGLPGRYLAFSSVEAY